MIISKEQPKEYGLANFRYEGDTVKYLHAQDIDPTLKEVAERRKEMHGGWSDNRSMRYVGSIPFIVLENNPDLKAAILSGDNSAIDRAMKLFFQTDEGKRYMANKLDTGKSAQCIVK